MPGSARKQEEATETEAPGSSDPSDPKTLRTMQSLMRLAQSGDTEEARNAAVKLALMCRQHEFALVPKSELERVDRIIDKAKALADEQKAGNLRSLAVGAVIGQLVFGKGKLL
jgi:hypothetical protein